MRYEEKKNAVKGQKNVGSKIVQVKGVMPLWGDLTRQTPTGRAVGRFVVWHNFSFILGKSYANFEFLSRLERKKRDFYGAILVITIDRGRRLIKEICEGRAYE